MPTPEIGYINVRVLEATGLESLSTARIDPKKISPKVSYLWGIPSRSKKGKQSGVYDTNSKSWKWPKAEGFSGQIAGGTLGDLISISLRCPKAGKLGEQQVKVVWAPEGGTDTPCLKLLSHGADQMLTWSTDAEPLTNFPLIASHALLLE